MQEYMTQKLKPVKPSCVIGKYFEADGGWAKHQPGEMKNGGVYLMDSVCVRHV